jgi:HlyD family secretion protein
MDITAPQAGVVLNLEVNTVGGVIPPGKPLLWIVPEGERLVLETRIDAMSRDQVWIGQSARVKFPGFNQRTTPEVTGLVKALGADAITDEHSGQRFFQAEIEIPPAELERLHAATSLDLTPGMPAEAYIQTAERSAASYLLKPILDNFARSMRED